MPRNKPTPPKALSILLFCGFLWFLAAPSFAQQSTSPSASAAVGTSSPEFLAAVDEVLHDMVEITGWQLKYPLKKSVRSRAEIHAYVVQQMNDEKDAKERYASARSAEAFGLIPKGFDLENFLVDLLTEQIAGLYDPKAQEFYIADWIVPDEQRMVMSHELTHALQDQHFHIEAWVKAARPNDDAELARESVLEGSAMAGMLEYELRDKGFKLKDMPEFDPSIFVGDLADTPMLKKAPPFLKDSLMFPYFSGLNFSMSVLRSGGWAGFAAVFANPPAGTQQIMHPALYRAGKVPAALTVDLPEGTPSAVWTRLEENSMGEFGWKEILKQFIGDTRASNLSINWDGDDYATFEMKNSKQLMIFARIRFNSEQAATDFFMGYNEALHKKYPDAKDFLNGRQLLSFTSDDGNVSVRCSSRECVTAQGADQATFAGWTKKLGYPAAATVSSEPRPVPAN